MKRDMDLIRQIVIAVRDRDGHSPLSRVDGVDDVVFAEHARLLDEAGLVSANILGSGRGPSNAAVIQRLTWEGQDFADAIDNETIWANVKGTAEKAGGWTFGLLLDIAKMEIKQRIGMDI